jgi:hypothetical protein
LIQGELSFILIPERCGTPAVDFPDMDETFIAIGAPFEEEQIAVIPVETDGSDMILLLG